MNIIFHALLSLLLARLLGINFIPYVLIGILFSILPDFDHIPYLVKAIKTRRFGIESRSPLHELVGLIFILSGSLIVEVIYPHLFLLAISCGLSHFIVDFLTRPSRPLYPFSNKEIDLNLYPRRLKEMFVCDTILTLILGLIYIMIALI